MDQNNVPVENSKNMHTVRGYYAPQDIFSMKKKENHARVTEFGSGNENADIRMRDEHPRRRKYPPPPLCQVGDKKWYSKLSLEILYHVTLLFI